MVSEPALRWRIISNPTGTLYTRLLAVNNQSETRTGLIGQPKEISTYNRSGQRELLTKMNYSSEIKNSDNIEKQGQFTEGLLNNEYLRNNYFTNRSTKTYFPSVLSSTQSYRNGVSIKNENTLYDFYTGQTLESTFKNSRNEVYHTRTVPAYYKFTNMGAKGDNAANSHMLSQQTASYTTKEKIGGSPYNSLDFLNPNTVEILSASVQTWQGDWSNYRVPNLGLNQSGYAEVANSPRQVWREEATYQWHSPALAANGSFENFLPFDWTGTPNTHWLRANENVRYDHYSHIPESRDVNGQHSANKSGHNESQILASAANAKYTEIAYSGAEDVPTVVNELKHFGGEVVTDGTQASGSQGAPQPHTGEYSAKLAAGQKIRYQATAGTDVATGKPYRLSAWIHSGDLPTNLGRLYASVNGNVLGETSITSAETKKAGAWYRLVLNVTIPAGLAGQSVEFGCRNTAGAANSTAVYVDDFRVCPLTATMTSQVYDPRTNRATYSLDNENLFTRYQYNSVGRLFRVYKETFDRPGDASPGGKIVKEYTYNYARNATYIVQASSTGTGRLTSSLGGLVNTIGLGGEVRYIAESTDCRSLFNLDEPDAIKLDGALVNSDRILPDGTQFNRLPNGCSLSNIHGSHNVELKFTTYVFPLVGTYVNGHCEICPSTGLNTGRVEYQIADGCNGYQTGVHYETSTLRCPLNTSGDGNINLQTKRTSAAASKETALPICDGLRPGTSEKPSVKHGDK